jgi:hypothetical protein
MNPQDPSQNPNPVPPTPDAAPQLPPQQPVGMPPAPGPEPVASAAPTFSPEPTVPTPVGPAFDNPIPPQPAAPTVQDDKTATPAAPAPMPMYATPASGAEPHKSKLPFLIVIGVVTLALVGVILFLAL